MDNYRARREHNRRVLALRVKVDRHAPITPGQPRDLRSGRPKPHYNRTPGVLLREKFATNREAGF